MRALANRIDGGAPEVLIIDDPAADLVKRGSTAPRTCETRASLLLVEYFRGTYS